MRGGGTLGTVGQSVTLIGEQLIVPCLFYGLTDCQINFDRLVEIRSIVSYKLKYVLQNVLNLNNFTSPDKNKNKTGA